MPYRYAAFLLALLLTAAPAAAQDATAQDADGPFMRHPAVSPDGETVAFSYQGDLWTVPTDGGRAYRLTVHEAYEAQPRWSADGQQIAFMSDRFGGDDLYVMDAMGGAPQRLTYHSATDRLGGWMPDGRLVFETDRTFQQVEWENEIYAVADTGGTPDRLLDALGYAPMPSPDGRFIAFERGSNAPDRKNYRGPANRDLWLYDTEADVYQQLTTFDGNDYGAVWAGPRTLLYVSEESGAYNLHRQALADDGQAEGDAEALTDYTDDGVRFFSASADGSTIAFERQTDVYVMQDGGQAQKLDVEVPRDYRFDPVERETLTDGAESYQLSPDGEYVAFVVRGEVFMRKNTEEESRTVRLTQHPYRDRDVAWIDSRHLIFASDREGDQYDLYRLESADDEEPDLFKSLKHRVVRLTDTPEDERNPTVSPDSQQVAFQRGRGQLVVAGLSDGEIGDKQVLLDGWATPNGVAWSPDSRWIAYSLPDLDFNHEIYIRDAAGEQEPVNISQHPKPDRSPVWSPDGTKLGFVSSRSSDDDVWFAWLREEDWEKTEEDWALEEDEEESEEEEEKDDEDEEEDEEPEPVEIDFEDIHERLERVTGMPGNEASPAISLDGETFFFVAGRDGRTQDYETDVDLYKIKWDGSEREALTESDVSPYAVQLSPDGEYVHMMQGGKLARIPVDGDGLETLAFSARMEIDHPQERRQAFAEAWRAINKGFYDPKFHGVDWQAMRGKYAPWAMQASTERDFRDVVNLMLGELNASHMGFYGSDRAETQRRETGLLGVELDPVERGVRVARVVPGSPADRERSTLRVGDVITAVNGEAVAEVPNFYALLEDTAEERIILGVEGEDGEEREVIIRPVESLSDELYREWVEDRRALVDEYSDGRLGYIHVEGMNWSSFERFERELIASGSGKEGLVVDVRYNGGGWTTDYLMAVLTVQRHAYTVPRGAAQDLEAEHQDFRGHYPFGERLPLASWTKPVAALCNENSYSNAEIFSHAFKSFGLGPLVGQPTFGAVISTGGVGLINGSYVRLPFRGWYVYPTDQNMEHGPAVPDLLVENAPDYRGSGEDAQLRRVVEELLQDVDADQQATRPAAETEGESTGQQ